MKLGILEDNSTNKLFNQPINILDRFTKRLRKRTLKIFQRGIDMDKWRKKI